MIEIETTNAVFGSMWDSFALLQSNLRNVATTFDDMGDTVFEKVVRLGRTGIIIAGALACFVGGAIAAWRATKGEDFTKALLFAIVGFLIASVVNQFTDATFYEP